MNDNGNAVAVGVGIEDGDYEWWSRPCGDMVIAILKGWEI